MIASIIWSGFQNIGKKRYTVIPGKRRNFVGQNFWARGYYVSTVGRDEETVRKYIQKQEILDKRTDQLELF